MFSWVDVFASSQLTVAERVWARTRQRRYVQVGNDRLSIWSLVAWQLGLWNHGVDHPMRMRFPRVSASAEENGPGPLHPALPVQGVQHPAESRRVAGHHAHEVPIYRSRVVYLRHERVPARACFSPPCQIAFTPAAWYRSLLFDATALGVQSTMMSARRTRSSRLPAIGIP
jgi:hypothetical protein